LHRAGDTAGAMLGTLIAAALLWRMQRGAFELAAGTFHTIVWWSLLPAVLAVLLLAFGAREVPLRQQNAPKLTLAGFDRRFLWFLGAVVIFTLGNSSDAFLLLRARERGLDLVQVLLMVASFNLIYALISGPAGALSDKIGRRRLIVFGWLVYGMIYLGFAVASAAWQVWALYALYGVYYGMAEGTAKALVADLVPAEKRGTAYGVYNAAVGLAAFPASAIAGVLAGPRRLEGLRPGSAVLLRRGVGGRRRPDVVAHSRLRSACRLTETGAHVSTGSPFAGETPCAGAHPAKM
ncbi:MAG TPA: MFS transporter, partial [Anaerolineae bacterium]|nr:MFS transporter [Anaerolineae bacterium]